MNLTKKNKKEKRKAYVINKTGTFFLQVWNKGNFLSFIYHKSMNGSFIPQSVLSLLMVEASTDLFNKDSL